MLISYPASKRFIFALSVMLGIVPFARAATYTDTSGDTQASPTSTNLDIGSVDVSHTATDLVVTVNTAGSLASPNDWGRYMIALNTDGNTATGQNVDMDPYGTHPIGLTGADFWFTAEPDAGTDNFYQWTGSSWNWLGTIPASAGTNSVTFSMPLATLGVSDGAAITFDVYTTGSFSGDPAIDALSNPNPTVATWTNTPYNSGSQVSTYVVPEPTSLAGVAVVLVSLMRRRAR